MSQFHFCFRTCPYSETLKHIDRALTSFSLIMFSIESILCLKKCCSHFTLKSLCLVQWATGRTLTLYLRIQLGDLQYTVKSDCPVMGGLSGNQRGGLSQRSHSSSALLPGPVSFCAKESKRYIFSSILHQPSDVRMKYKRASYT